MIPEELTRAVANRTHWTAEDPAAVYRPPAGYEVLVREVAGAKAAERWYAVLRIGDRAARRMTGYSAREVVEWAERVKPPRTPEGQ